MDRRTALKWLVQGAGLIAGAIIFIPSLISALSPAAGARRATLWRRLGRLGQFPVGAVREAIIGHVADDATGGGAGRAPLPREAVYVWRRQPDEFVVFSRACTDLGCPVNYDPGSQFYYCPCHGGIFNTAGVPVAGPPARPLYQYATRIRNGVLEIDVKSVPVPA